MALATATTYVALVNESHTITLPADVPVGAQVAIVLLPDQRPREDDADRHARFAKVLAAIREAQADNYTTPEVSDSELDDRINRARQAHYRTPSG